MRSRMARPVRAFSALLLFALALLAGIPRAAEAEPGQVLCVAGAPAHAREAPSESAPVLLALQPGEHVLELERREGWVRINLYYALGRDGWIALEGLQPCPHAERRVPEPTPPARNEADAEPPEPPAIRVEILGTPAIPFRLTCLAYLADGSRKRYSARTVGPKAYLFAVAALECVAEKERLGGRLTLRLIEDGVVVAQETTRFALGRVWARTQGPWGRPDSGHREPLLPRELFFPGSQMAPSAMPD